MKYRRLWVNEKAHTSERKDNEKYKRKIRILFKL